MSSVGSTLNPQRGVKPVRVIVIINFVLMLALIGPGSSHKLDLALRRAGLANLITLSLQVWVVGSTILATALFVRALVKGPDTFAGKPQRPAPLDLVLLLAWWIVMILLCLFAFMMGMGGQPKLSLSGGWPGLCRAGGLAFE
jgi:hypothetical protein